MKPITPVKPGFNFPITNFAATQEEYLTLPAFRTPDGAVCSRWGLSWKERIRVLFSGSIWLTQLTFNTPLQPVKLESKCPLVCGTIPQGVYRKGDTFNLDLK